MTDYADLAVKMREQLSGLLERVDAVEDELRHPLDADSSEQAVDLADDEAMASVDDVLHREIAQIRAALLRIENGTYGTCSGCGQTIGHARLAALPTATRCIDCAE